MFGIINTVVLLVYLLIMLGLGLGFLSGNRTADHYFRGGGTLPWWATGISIFATMLSAITFLAMPAKAFATNWNMLFFNFMVPVISPFVVYLYLPMFRKYGGRSAYTFLEERFNRKVRWFASGLFVLFMISRIAIVLYLPSIALSLVTGMNVWGCILVTGLVTLFYSTMGGIKAVVWGDVIQGFVLVGGALFTFGWLIFHLDGGMFGFIQQAYQAGKLETFNFSFDFSQPVFWVVILGGASSSIISYTSDQTLIQRYSMADDSKQAARSIWLNAWLVPPITILFFSIGTALYVFYHNNPTLLDQNLSQNDAIYPWFIVHQLPPGISGMLIASIFAASMSTLSSNINSASAALLGDFYKVLYPNSNDHSEIRFARNSGIVIGLAGIAMAIVLATWDIKSLWDQFNVFLGLFTGTLGALFFLAFFVPKVDGRGAICGIIGSIILTWLIKETTSLHLLLYGLVEIILCCLIAMMTSRRKQKKVCDFKNR